MDIGIVTFAGGVRSMIPFDLVESFPFPASTGWTPPPNIREIPTDRFLPSLSQKILFQVF
jgi:hypothetical protein